MAGEVEKAGMPDRPAVGSVVSQYGGGHIVENEAQATAMEVLEGARQPLEQCGLPLVAIDIRPQLAGGAQQSTQEVNARERTADGEGVG